MNEPSGFPPFKPAEANFERLVREQFAHAGLIAHMGAWLIDATPGRVVVELPYSDRIGEGDGLFHAAIVGALAESAASFAAQTLLPAAVRAKTLEYKINLLQPARGQILRATGEILRLDQTLTVARAAVEVLGGLADGPCAALQATITRDTADGRA
ncbi:MAG: PaaI family thioesterase [Hyphomicrobiaceae bacterium]